MDVPAHPSSRPAAASLAVQFTPKLVTVLREGYGWASLRADMMAGLTVAIVALPLSMAIAIGSGLSPDKGLITAIVGGFLVSALGGSRFQVGGPAGAFIVLVATIVERHGYDGLVLATLMAGVMLMAAGFLRLGTSIRYIPFPVTVGFTAGIAVIIFSSQIKELLGLDIAREPAALLPKLVAIAGAIGTVKPVTVAMSALALGLIIGLRRYRPKWPVLLIAVAVTAALTALLKLDVATIGSRFGTLPNTIPLPSLPAFHFEKLSNVFPDAIAIALLGAVESLLSAVVADGMSGRRHRSNGELVAQGVANIAAVMFGGMCVTGTIARTATNVRAGAVSPVSGMLHALYLLIFVMIAAPLASYIPLAALGAVLAIVSWNMAEKEEFAALVRASWGDAVVVLATFFLTIFSDLTIAIATGVTLGAFVVLQRMAQTVNIQAGLTGADQGDGSGVESAVSDPLALEDDMMVYRLSGAVFFGATAAVSAVLDSIGERPRVFVLDFSEVPLVDSTAAKMLQTFVGKLTAAGTIVYLAGASTGVRRSLLATGLREPLVSYAGSAQEAADLARAAVPPKAGEVA